MDKKFANEIFINHIKTCESDFHKLYKKILKVYEKDKGSKE